MERGHIDIVCGGQFGDEGKGAVASWLCTNQGGRLPEYDFSVRVGGYNAEHRFVHAGKNYLCRVLPCGLVESSIRLYLGAGHLFSIDALNQEVNDMKVDPRRIFIDGNAGIVTEKHMNLSANANREMRGGTTGQGAGKAATDKVLRDGTFKTAGDSVPLSVKYSVTNVADRISRDLQAGGIGLLEGSQGALISLNHGYYPYCCAKDVTPAGILAEVGAGISDVKDVYVVYRAYPMRVPGASGPAKGDEVNWDEIEKRLGYALSKDMKRQTQPDGSKGDYERIFEWNWEEFRHSLNICSPTKMILTFADWHHPSNLKKNKFEDLDVSTRNFIEGMEACAEDVLGRRVPVVMVRTGPSEEDYLIR